MSVKVVKASKKAVLCPRVVYSAALVLAVLFPLVLACDVTVTGFGFLRSEKEVQISVSQGTRRVELKTKLGVTLMKAQYQPAKQALTAVGEDDVCTVRRLKAAFGFYAFEGSTQVPVLFVSEALLRSKRLVLSAALSLAAVLLLAVALTLLVVKIARSCPGWRRAPP